MSAQIARAAAALFVLLLAMLHFLKPDVDPSWRFISEYAIGEHGWVMSVAFLALGLSYAALFMALKSELRGISGRIGLALLLVSAAGLAIAACFTTDPITTPREALSRAGRLHEVGGALGIGMPLAMLVISIKVLRAPAWMAARRSIALSAAIALLSSIGFMIAVIVMLPADGRFGPDVLVGWPNRIEVVAYAVWIALVASHAFRRAAAG